VSALDPNDVFHEECYPILEKLLNLEMEALCPLTFKSQKYTESLS